MFETRVAMGRESMIGHTSNQKKYNMIAHTTCTMVCSSRRLIGKPYALRDTHSMTIQLTCTMTNSFCSTSAFV